jgi:hypothetical protein
VKETKCDVRSLEDKYIAYVQPFALLPLQQNLNKCALVGHTPPTGELAVSAAITVSLRTAHGSMVRTELHAAPYGYMESKMSFLLKIHDIVDDDMTPLPRAPGQRVGLCREHCTVRKRETNAQRAGLQGRQ